MMSSDDIIKIDDIIKDIFGINHRVKSINGHIFTGYPDDTNNNRRYRKIIITKAINEIVTNNTFEDAVKIIGSVHAVTQIRKVIGLRGRVKIVGHKPLTRWDYIKSAQIASKSPLNDRWFDNLEDLNNMTAIEFAKKHGTHPKTTCKARLRLLGFRYGKMEEKSSEVKIDHTTTPEILGISKGYLRKIRFLIQKGKA